jgi:hypothetical protein
MPSSLQNKKGRSICCAPFPASSQHQAASH